ncbi:orotidine-5'-phosphate decarboxylase [Mycetocola spongiae]|uniref:orotidine-5'-phosphate decarboxylase n=1 Tax=Mycetocola spongiae TaxID=2859226 RepID=UPI001CF24F7B|nr:orotidine-5'-phosphate decarboxylase [Mycetocola spongiae]UCR89594.1 orotidine-5'-phosphate decarboxylase [Mycetocola spongiae]
MIESFGSRLERVFARSGRLCVGIDPHSFLLSAWGLADTAEGAREFGLRVVEATAGRAGIIKPQVAFYERFGSAGYRALEEVLAAARAADLLVIADAKRGDVGTSVEAYGQSWLAEGSPLEADALTLAAFQGVGSIAAPLALARERGKGIFVLAATSNPEGRDIQRARTADGRTVSRRILDDVAQWNAGAVDPATIGDVGLVIGATLDLSEFDLDLETPPDRVLPILAPGFGAQGARLEDTTKIYGPLSSGVIISASRSVLSAGPENIAEAVKTMSTQITDEYHRA